MEGGCGLWSKTKCALLDISTAYEVRIPVVILFDGGGSLAVVHNRACTDSPMTSLLRFLLVVVLISLYATVVVNSEERVQQSPMPLRILCRLACHHSCQNSDQGATNCTCRKRRWIFKFSCFPLKFISGNHILFEPITIPIGA